MSFCLCVVAAGAELTVDVSAQGQWDGRAAATERIGALLESPNFDLRAALGISSDGKYGPDIANWRGRQSFFDNYLVLEEGQARARWDRLSLEAGRAPQAELFASPYSLFLNADHPGLVGAAYRYRDRHFTFENRWIELNRSSDFLTSADSPPGWAAAGATGFPDRGASLKTLVFRWDEQAFGINDAAVYTGRSFDAEYFLSPMPSYFTQYVKATAGRPWMTGSNENNLIGFFYTCDPAGAHFGAQVLIDDFSLHFVLPDQVPDNPWKVAWTLGGWVDTSTGRWGLWQAGATKYTFAPYSMTAGHEAATAYGYTLYPDNEYRVGDRWRGLSVEDNALGYRHGENNLALLVTHEAEVARGLRWAGSAEATLSGTKSPANPWHDGTLAREYGTQLLNEAPLETRLTGTGRLTWTVEGFDLWLGLTGGWVWHELRLRDPEGVAGDASGVDRYTKLYAPSDYCGPFGSLTLGVRTSVDLGQRLWGTDDE